MRYLVVVVMAFLYIPSVAFAQSGTVNIEALVPGCGNGVIETGESCDGTNYAGQSCSTIGFASGALACSASCTLITASCIAVPANTSGGATRRIKNPLITNAVIISGDTSPRSLVYVLRDGVRIATGYSNQLGEFQIPLPSYYGTANISLLVETPNGLRSSAFAFPFGSYAQGTTKIDHIFLGPSVDMSRSAVVVGEPLDVFGEAKPGTIVTGVIYSNGAAILSATTTVPVSGTYTLPVPTTSLVPGTYTFLAYAQTSERISAPSRILMFTVGSQSIPRYRDYDSCAFIRGDVNRDCRVNYEDILLAYTWKKAGSGEGLIELESLSGDGKVNMRDFSIILYYWTG